MTAVVIALLVTGAILLVRGARGELRPPRSRRRRAGRRCGPRADAAGVSLWLVLVLVAVMTAGLASLGLVATRAACGCVGAERWAARRVSSAASASFVAS